MIKDIPNGDWMGEGRDGALVRARGRDRRKG